MRAALTSDGCEVRFRDYGLFQAKFVEEEIPMTLAILGSVESGDDYQSSPRRPRPKGFADLIYVRASIMYGWSRLVL